MLYWADSRFVPSQWEKALLSNDVSIWLCANLEWTLSYTAIGLYHNDGCSCNDAPMRRHNSNQSLSRTDDAIPYWSKRFHEIAWYFEYHLQAGRRAVAILLRWILSLETFFPMTTINSLRHGDINVSVSWFFYINVLDAATEAVLTCCQFKH